MIIFGLRGLTTTPDRGEFSCPSCRRLTPYARKRVRRFFTLYFVPLIPLDKLGEYIECTNCKNSYNEGVLTLDPEKLQQQIEAEYQTAIRKVMIHMLLADGVINESEVVRVRSNYQQVAGVELTSEQVKEEIEAVKASREELSQYLVKMQGFLNYQGKEAVVKAALITALADGELQKEELKLINDIANQLGMSKEEVASALRAYFRGAIGSA